MEKSFVFGMVVAMLLVALFSSGSAIEYLSDNIKMGTSAVSGVASPTALSDGATKGYVDTAATFSCMWESVDTTACNRARCYANKPTADKVCQDKGYQYASTYTGHDTNGALVQAYIWIGNSWTVPPGSEDRGYMGGFDGTGGLNNQFLISSVLCCE